MLIRRETPPDHDAIRATEAAAFRSDEQPKPVEPKLIDELRADGDLIPALSLVALYENGAIIGHVCCSAARIDGTAAPVVGLGPIGVWPEMHRHGVGSSLMHAVIGAADALDYALIGVLGDPKFYSRFGFVPSAEHGINPPNPEWSQYFQVRPLTAYGADLRGTFHYAPAFDRL